MNKFKNTPKPLPKPLPRPRDLKSREGGAVGGETTGVGTGVVNATVGTNVGLMSNVNKSNESIMMSHTLANGIMCHEKQLYDLSVYYFSIAASKGITYFNFRILYQPSLLGDPTGLFMYAVSLRHGWYLSISILTKSNHPRGVKKNEKEAFRLLELVTESVGMVNVPDIAGKPSCYADHIPLALLEVCCSVLRYR